MKQQANLLLVDDDRHVLASMADWLRDQGYAADTATNLGDARTAVDRKQYDLVLADIRLGDEDGFDLLAHCRENHPATAVIMITGYGTVEAAIEAIRLGAFDFLTKPLIDEELLVAIQRAINQQKVIEENKTLKAQLDLRFGMENIVGHDHRMLKIFDMIDAVADTRATVLITGESGTGKSLVARAIHRRSGGATSRSSRSPAVHCPKRCWKANCSATSPAPSPGRSAKSSASSSWPTRARSSSTKSAPPVRPCRLNCSAFCRTWSSSKSAERRRFASIPA